MEGKLFFSFITGWSIQPNKKLNLSHRMHKVQTEDCACFQEPHRKQSTAWFMKAEERNLAIIASLQTVMKMLIVWADAFIACYSGTINIPVELKFLNISAWT